jgi:hypothetical protein
MNQASTSWRSMIWARWLGWTLVFGLVLVGSTVLSAVIPLEGASILFTVAPLLAAFLIGVRYPNWWWAAGPLVALLVPVAVLILLVAVLSFGPQTPVPTPIGPLTPREQLLFILTLGSTGIVLFGFLFAPVAAAGVAWGKRRADSAALGDGDHANDASGSPVGGTSC